MSSDGFPTCREVYPGCVGNLSHHGDGGVGTGMGTTDSSSDTAETGTGVSDVTSWISTVGGVGTGIAVTEFSTTGIWLA